MLEDHNRREGRVNLRCPNASQGQKNTDSLSKSFLRGRDGKEGRWVGACPRRKIDGGR